MIVIMDVDNHDSVVLGDDLERALEILAKEDSMSKIDEIRYLIKRQNENRKWRR